VTTIKKAAFARCDELTTITIPNSVTSIGDFVFTYCTKLTGTIAIPSSVLSIGEGNFSACTGLTRLDVDVNNPNYSSLEGVLFNKSQDTLLQCPAGKTGSYSIPNSVTTISNSAFYYCSVLTSITIPNSVTTIGEYAFYTCSGLTSITIPYSVIIIGVWTFAYCSNLTEIHVKAVNPPRIFGDIFVSVSKSIPVYVPCGRETDYRNTYGWDYFTNIKEDCTGTRNLSSEHPLAIYPNPATDNINITLPENISHAVFTLYDMQGKVLIKQEINNQETVAVNNLASGIYIYNVRTNKQSYQGKIIRK
jgi:hypothetical protein